MASVKGVVCWRSVPEVEDGGGGGVGLHIVDEGLEGIWMGMEGLREKVECSRLLLHTFVGAVAELR